MGEPAGILIFSDPYFWYEGIMKQFIQVRIMSLRYDNMKLTLSENKNEVKSRSIKYEQRPLSSALGKLNTCWGVVCG